MRNPQSRSTPFHSRMHANLRPQCHTHPKVKDGPKRRRETHAVRARAASSASTNSSGYPIKSEGSTSSQPSDSSTHHRHSTPIPASSLHALGIPTSTPTLSAATPQPSAAALYPPSSAYPTPTSSTAMHPPANPLSEMHHKPEPIVGLFTSPLQPAPSFSAAHAVSEPELVGVPRTTALSSLASMI